MAVHSMTGFARREGRFGAFAWTWEVRSVNAKGFDVRCRLPQGLERLESALRSRAQQHMRRGNVTAGLSLAREAGGQGYRINEAFLDHLLAILPRLKERLPDAGAISLDGLLQVRGVVEMSEDEITDSDREAFDAELLQGFDQVMTDLEAMRAAEGARLVSGLRQQLAHVRTLTREAEETAATRPDAIRERLKAQVEQLLEDVPALPEERLAQEAAVLMVKADVREEIDRLAAHVIAAEELLDEAGGVGRKLDFLCQEFNREANTLCSKAQSVELTRIGLDLKSTIDQFREQVQNIE